MDSFAERLQVGRAFEDQVRDRLERDGWESSKFGQEQLPEKHRRILRRQDTSIRHMPDVLASRMIGELAVSAFFDAKSGEVFRRTGKHGIETASLMALVEWKRAHKLPTYIVTADWCLHDPEYVLSICEDGHYLGKGSGTPFKLWYASEGQPWDQFFDLELIELMAR